MIRKKVTIVEEFKITKTVADQNLVFGYANVSVRKNGEQVQDLQDDMIDPDDLEKAAYEFVEKYRAANVNHEGCQVGDLVECVALTIEKMEAMGIPAGTVPQGIWLGFKVNDATFAKVKNGELRMFSIEGSSSREEA